MEKYKDYACEYKFDGKTWGINIRAKSETEAYERMKSMFRGVVKGVLVETIEA